MRLSTLLPLLCALVTVMSLCTSAYYVPATVPISHQAGSEIWISVNSMTSTTAVMPFGHYSIKSCAPNSWRMQHERRSLTLGELLWGDRIESSEYVVRVDQNVSCRFLCPEMKINKEEMDLIVQRIESDYRGNMILDNLPVGEEAKSGPRSPKVDVGYPLGISKKKTKMGKTLINNHLQFTIATTMHPNSSLEAEYHLFRIVGFYVTAHSVDHSAIPHGKSCPASGDAFNPSDHPVLTSDAVTITYSYSVNWVPGPGSITWGTRWNAYFRGGKDADRIHWLAVCNSFACFLLVSVALMIFVRLALNAEKVDKSCQGDKLEGGALWGEEEQEGWELLRNEVFRPPSAGHLLAVLVGFGAQIGGMISVTLSFALLGFLSPDNRGGLLSAGFLWFLLFGSFGAYCSARLQRLFKCPSWDYPFVTGVPLLMYLSLYVVQWMKASSSAVPFSVLFVLLVWWLALCVPLCILGARMGFNSPVLEIPCACNIIPRSIPLPCPWYRRKWVMVLGAGMLTLSSCCVELRLILDSFWKGGQLFNEFGFVALVFLIVTVTCAEVSIVLVYFQLTGEDHHWWWRSWLMTASTGIYVFLHACYYLVTELNIHQGCSIFLYLGYMAFVSLAFGCYIGCIGFYAAFFFLRKLYDSKKETTITEEHVKMLN